MVNANKTRERDGGGQVIVGSSILATGSWGARDSRWNGPVGNGGGVMRASHPPRHHRITIVLQCQGVTYKLRIQCV
jgi:hypothetical protein